MKVEHAGAWKGACHDMCKCHWEALLHLVRTVIAWSRKVERFPLSGRVRTDALIACGAFYMPVMYTSNDKHNDNT